MCTHAGKSRSALYSRCTSRNDAHGDASLGGNHSASNRIFVHPLYGAVQLHGGRPRTFPTGCIHILGIPVAPCTLGVRLEMTLMVIHHSAANTLPPTEFLYSHVQLNGGRPRTSPTGSVRILGSPVAPCSLGVQFRMTIIVIQISAVNTLPSMEFSYTCCTDLYSSMAMGPYVSQAVYTLWEVP